MKYQLGALLLVSVIFMNCTTEESMPSVRINGKSVFIGEKVESIKKKLGIPNLEKIVKENGKNRNVYRMDYDGFTVHYNEYDYEISAIIIKKSGYTTDKGISVGDSLEKLKEKYGAKPAYEGKGIENGKEIYLVIYRSEFANKNFHINDQMEYVAVIENNHIVEFSIWYSKTTKV